MANQKNTGQESTARPQQVSAPHLPAGPLPNKYLHKLGRSNTQQSPYGTGAISTTPSTRQPDNPKGY